MPFKSAFPFFSWKAVSARFQEAHGVTLDEDEGWTRLSGDGKRDLTSMNQSRMQKLAFHLWEENLLANRLIELPVAYLLAEGVSIVVDDEEAQEIANAFWHDPINCLDLKLEKKVRELSLFGEQCYPVFVNRINGHVRLGYLDPSEIQRVVTDPDNAEQPIGVVTKQDSRQQVRKYRVIVLGEDSELFSRRTQEIRKTFDDGDCFFFKINDLSNSKRGRSDLLPQIDWLDAYDQFLFGEIDRSAFLRAFVWDVTITGATPEQVEERAKQITPPPPGSVRVHNDSEEWEAQSPSLNAGDTDSYARLFRNHVLGGGTIPEHWYGGGGDVNRSTGESMGEPTFKIMSMRQTRIKAMLEMMVKYAIWQKIKARRATTLIDVTALNVEAVFPEMTARDTTKYASALQQVAAAMIQLLDRELITEEFALNVLASITGRLGVELDCAQVLEDARGAAQARAETDADFELADDGPSGGALPPEPGAPAPAAEHDAPAVITAVISAAQRWLEFTTPADLLEEEFIVRRSDNSDNRIVVQMRGQQQNQESDWVTALDMKEEDLSAAIVEYKGMTRIRIGVPEGDNVEGETDIEVSF